jgi:hypothetical protein
MDPFLPQGLPGGVGDFLIRVRRMAAQVMFGLVPIPLERGLRAFWRLAAGENTGGQ